MPNDIIPINPEHIEVAQLYLQGRTVDQIALELETSAIQVTQTLATREVKKYIDHMYLEAGYRNRNRIADALDKIIDKKLEEIAEAEVGSTKDIADLLALAHKMRMDELKAQAEHNKIEAPKQQTNIQINESPFGAQNYGNLLEKLLGG
jgi:hypothetical protein